MSFPDFSNTVCIFINAKSGIKVSLMSILLTVLFLAGIMIMSQVGWAIAVLR